eukprot:SAG31_NODE_9558_length_1258_cov_25.253667_2_plen_225_part_00
MLKNLVARSKGMRGVLEDIIDILEEENIILKVRYIESARNPSDWYSRVRDKAEWRLREDLARKWMHRWGTAQVDRFADASSAQLRRFNAAYPCRGCEAVDTYSVDWSHSHSWINPPWNHIARVLYKLRCEPLASGVLLLPKWETADWWPTLLQLTMDGDIVDVEFPASAFQRGALMLPDETPEPLGNRGWKLVVAFVPARGMADTLYSRALNTGAVQAQATHEN